MATDTNMDWSQSAPTGYVPAFRSGNVNQLGHSHDVNNSYMMRGQASLHDPRSQYGTTADYNSHNAHLTSSLHAGLHVPASGIEEHFWQQQTDTTRDNLLPNTAPAPQDEPVHDEPAIEAEDTLVIDAEPVPAGPVRGQKTTIPRSERRKHYKPRPEPSHPRLFRPFVPLETADTTPAQWMMPPIVGTWLMFSNKLVKYRPMPPDIQIVREKFFKMEESIFLKNSQEVADYVPHITNIWRRAVRRVDIDEESGVQTEFWYCRTAKAMRTANNDSQAKGIRNRERKSQTLFNEQDLCKMRIRVTSYTKHADRNPFHLRIKGSGKGEERFYPGSIEGHDRWGGGPCKCVAEWVHFELANVDPTPDHHTHELDVMDAYKRSEALQVLAKNKCEEGNNYAATCKWMQKTFGETSKQVYKFEKGDTANAAQAWRAGTRDYMLREEVPEDSDEMTTMRRCVDAIVEADARSLREALREVLKDSDALTKSALAILEKHKPAVPSQDQEPWRLTEGVAVIDLPSPGAPEIVKRHVGVYGPPRTAYPPSPPVPHATRWERPQVGPPPIHHTHFMGPDGRPIPSSNVPAPGTMAPPQVRAGQAQQHMHQQCPGFVPGNMPPTHGAQLQPRPPAAAYGPTPGTEVRYVPAPSGPAPPPVPVYNAPPQVNMRHAQAQSARTQQGSLHPITVTMEVHSCSRVDCKQCKHMSRETAGRTFLFQDSLSTAAHFTKLQDLLRDPKQLLDDNYTRVLHKSQVPLYHPHPALHTPQPQRPGPRDAPPLQRAPASAPSVPGRQLQWVPAPGHPVPPPQQPAARSTQSTGVQTTHGASDVAPAQPQPAAVSIYNQPLPVPTVIEVEDDADADAGDDAATGGVDDIVDDDTNVKEVQDDADADDDAATGGVDDDADDETNVNKVADVGHDDAATSGVDDNADDEANVNEVEDRVIGDNLDTEYDRGDDDYVPGNDEDEDDNGEDEDGVVEEDEGAEEAEGVDEDEDEQRPAKRKKI